MMNLVWIKVFATPLLIAAVTVIARHYGPKIAGVLVGLPLTSGPISFFLAAERGPAFAARAAVGGVAGMMGVGAFCAAYVLLARRAAWQWSTAVGIVFFFVANVGLQFGPHALASTVAIVLAVMVSCWVVMLRSGIDRAALHVTRPTPPPAWDIPVRMILATALVLLLTCLAGVIGARWSGVLSAFPVFTAILAAFAHARDGSAAARKLLCGTMGGAIAAAIFFGTVGALVGRSTLLLTYSIAVIAAVLVSSTLGRVHISGDTRGLL